MQAAGQEELDIVKQQLILTMRTTSSPAHNKLAVVLEKLVGRIRLAALGAQQRRAARERAAQAGGRQPGSAQRSAAPIHRRLIFVSPKEYASEEEEDVRGPALPSPEQFACTLQAPEPVLGAAGDDVQSARVIG